MKLPIKIVGCLMIAYVVKSAVLRTDSDSFAEYVVKFDKQYQTAEEYQRRFHIWQESIKFIQKHNDEESASIHSYRVGINAFTDITHEEYKDKMLTYKSKQNTENGHTVSMYSGSYDDLPDSVDWKAKGYVTEVGNQGQCGSCWAFTATGALEGAHKKKTGMLVDLSEQNLMDCSSKQGNDGCEGGMMEYSYKYVKENGGIDTEKSYPYNVSNPQVGKCKYTEKDRGATCTGYVDLPKGNEKALQEAIANIGPIAIAVDASHQGFEMYKSGVYDDPNCSSKNIDHSMVIVGYGVENGKEYYYCKNSWGTSWGDNGYIKMVRNKNNQCGIATEASYPTV